MTASKFYSWLQTYFEDRGFQNTKSGFKGGADLGKHVLESTTGFWGNAAYSSGKPPRWIFHVSYKSGAAAASIPAGLAEIGIGASNTAQGNKAGLTVRVLPIIEIDDHTFHRLDEFEINALFIFHGALTAGSSSDAFTFTPSTGQLKRLGQPEDYIFAALLGLRPRSDQVTIKFAGAARSISYGEILDSIQALVTITPKGKQSTKIPKYVISVPGDLERLKSDIISAWDNAGPAPTPSATVEDDDTELPDFSKLEVPENPDLLGLDPAVYRQINAMLKSGKQHLMLYGPPGTGKTSLARWIANSLPGGKSTLITGSSDWSSQDIIGGYQPIGAGNVEFVPGILLRTFDQPLIIDELNRCDIDKVIGPLFTVLSGQQTTLPYRTDISDKESPPYIILPNAKPAAAAHEFAPGQGWRLIATINSIDKASLYQMSYALSRRFGWVYVDAPRDLIGFIRDFLRRKDPTWPVPAPKLPCPLADLWAAINGVRVIGPAPIIDAIVAMKAIDPSVSIFGPPDNLMRSAALDALDMVILPMLDGIVRQDATSIADSAVKSFAFTGEDEIRIRARLESVAI